MRVLTHWKPRVVLIGLGASLASINTVQGFPRVFKWVKVRALAYLGHTHLNHEYCMRHHINYLLMYGLSIDYLS